MSGHWKSKRLFSGISDKNVIAPGSVLKSRWSLWGAIETTRAPEIAELRQVAGKLNFVSISLLTNH